MSTAPAVTSPVVPSHSLREHAGRTLRLALPVMVARLGILLLVTVDTAMVGHAGELELARYGLGAAPQVPMLLVGIGMMLGTAVLTAHADGAGRFEECGPVLRVALVHAAVCGLLLALLCQTGEWLLAATGQSRDLARGGGQVLAMFGWGMPAALLYSATSFFLEAINRPKPGVVVMLLANLLNAALNWIFIYGHLGSPAMGATGAALATSIVRWFMFLATLAVVLLMVDRRRYGLTGSVGDARAIGRRLRGLGYPMALTQGLESSAFSSMVLIAGLLGAAQVGAYLIAMNLVALAFMCSIGIATAASVRVANAMGRRDATGVRRAGWVALGLGQCMLVLVGLALFTGRHALAAAFTDDPAVLAVALPTIAVASVVVVPDGAQAVLMGALRGTSDLWPATLRYLFSFWLVMVPLGWLLADPGGGGAPGLMQAVLVGCLSTAALLGVRFHRVGNWL